MVLSLAGREPSPAVMNLLSASCRASQTIFLQGKLEHRHENPSPLSCMCTMPELSCLCIPPDLKLVAENLVAPDVIALPSLRSLPRPLLPTLDTARSCEGSCGPKKCCTKAIRAARSFSCGVGCHQDDPLHQDEPIR